LFAIAWRARYTKKRKRFETHFRGRLREVNVARILGLDGSSKNRRMFGRGVGFFNGGAGRFQCTSCAAGTDLSNEGASHDMRIVNRTKHLLIVTLNSGISLHLAPGQTSEPIDARELAGNEKLEKLRRTGIVSIASTNAA
jgi:hypothetical protein